MPLNFRFVSVGVPGKHNRPSGGGSGLRRVHLQGFWEQRSGRVPHHHPGVRAAAAQAAAETQQLPQRPEAGVAAPSAASAGPDWANGPGPGHQEGPRQELHAHVDAQRQKICSICT